MSLHDPGIHFIYFTERQTTTNVRHRSLASSAINAEESRTGVTRVTYDKLRPETKLLLGTKRGISVDASWAGARPHELLLAS